MFANFDPMDLAGFLATDPDLITSKKDTFS